MAGLAPGNKMTPPGFRCLAARLAEMHELHTDCFHIRSAFFTKSGESTEPPAHPPAEQRHVCTDVLGVFEQKPDCSLYHSDENLWPVFFVNLL